MFEKVIDTRCIRNETAVGNLNHFLSASQALSTPNDIIFNLFLVFLSKRRTLEPAFSHMKGVTAYRPDSGDIEALWSQIIYTTALHCITLYTKYRHTRYPAYNNKIVIESRVENIKDINMVKKCTNVYFIYDETDTRVVHRRPPECVLSLIHI